MTPAKVDAIAKAVIYEGYLLYPYRTSNIKNQQRFTFGGVYPPAFDLSTMQTQCLLTGGPSAEVEITVRFLHLVQNGDVVERTVQAPSGINFDGLDGRVEVARDEIRPGLTRLTVRIVNSSAVVPADRDQALRHTFLSTHTILSVREGAFPSMADPPEDFREAAAACQNVGTWPVLVGEPGEHDTLLSSPIILEDYPRVAEESPGDLFDATEVDELLSLSILSLTDEEKAQMRTVDERARELLARTEALTADDLLKLHGSMRGMRTLREEST
ncbi:MAG: hypothetical protein M3077_12405 [Candidatus Dormibacteraeota bacterium]|nr:hypothetical protein [Candidatus Dormibacteraeota bacterium]